MSFSIDKQTLSDLDIFGKRSKRSVYSLFNSTVTHGGAQLLEEMFRYPLDNADAINRRSEMIRYIHSLGMAFPLEPALVDAAENYLANTDSRSQLTVNGYHLGQKFRAMIGSDIEQQLLIKGIEALVTILHDLRKFLSQVPGLFTAGRFKEGLLEIHGILGEPNLQIIFEKRPGKKMSLMELAELDKVLRFGNIYLLKNLLHYIYLLDVYMAISQVAVSQNFVYAVAAPKGYNSVRLKNVYHPFLKEPVANSIDISGDKNIVFLTGANMAGKSTFMKAVGIALFLAHMGFPVPAEKMEFSVCDGLLTTINLSDNLNVGYSHFYAEVLRVKKMAEQVKMGKKVFFIFDELFRGTNVKDAYEATVAITAALAEKSNCMFMVSTHIMEAGEVLQKQHQHINFIFLPTIMNGTQPVYTYRLEKGISDDRHGMLIIQNENILNILKKTN